MSTNNFNMKHFIRDNRDPSPEKEVELATAAFKAQIDSKLHPIYDSIEDFTISFFDRLNEKDLYTPEEMLLCFWQTVGLRLGSERLGELLKEHAVLPLDLLSIMYSKQMIREGTFVIEQALRYGPLASDELTDLIDGYSGHYYRIDGDFEKDSRAMHTMLIETFEALSGNSEIDKALKILKQHGDEARIRFAKLFGTYGDNYTMISLNGTLSTELEFILEDRNVEEVEPIAQAINGAYDPVIIERLRTTTWTLPTAGRYLREHPWLQQAVFGLAQLGHPEVPIVVVDQSNPELFAKNRTFITELSSSVVHVSCDDVLKLLDAIDSTLRRWVVAGEDGSFQYSGARNATMLTGPLFAHFKREKIDWKTLSKEQLLKLFNHHVFHGGPISMGDDDLTTNASTLLHYAINVNYKRAPGEFNISRTPCYGRMTAGTMLKQPALLGKYYFTHNCYYLALFVGCILSRPCILIPTAGGGEEASVNSKELTNELPLIGQTPAHLGGTRAMHGLYAKNPDGSPTRALKKRADEYYERNLLWIPNNIINDILFNAGCNSITGHAESLLGDLQLIGSAPLEAILEAGPGENLEGTISGTDHLPESYKTYMFDLATSIKKITCSNLSIEEKKKALKELLTIAVNDNEAIRAMKNTLSILITGELIDLARATAALAS